MTVISAKSYNGQSAGARLRWLAVVLLLGLTVVVYWQAGSCDFINFDDHEYVTENPHVLDGLSLAGIKWAFTSFHANNWHPLTWISHMADVSLFGVSPVGHHGMNVFWHVANTILLFLALNRLTQVFWRSLAVAAIFALHPLHVESVAWISERKDVLSAFFGLLAVYSYAGYGQSLESESGQATRRQRFYWLALIGFAASLLCKPMLVTLPVLFLLLDFWPLKRFPPGSRNAISGLLKEKFPFFCLSAASCIVTLMAQRSAMQTWQTYPLSVRLANALVSYYRYLGKSFWPVDLALPYPAGLVWAGWQVAGASAVLTAVTVITWLSRKTQPALLVGWLWFMGMLIPVIGLVQVGPQSMADRYMYLPLVGLSIAVIWRLAGWFKENKPGSASLIVLLVVAILACAWQSRMQLSYWRDSGALFTHAVAVTRNNDVAYSNLGNHQLEHGDQVAAVTNLLQALRTMGGLAVDPENLIAKLAASRSDDTETREILSVLERTDSKRLAAFADILANLGVAYTYNGQQGQGVRCYQAALRIQPDHALALHNLAAELAAQRQISAALELLDRAVRSQPQGSPALHQSRGDLLVASGRTAEAMVAYDQALLLDQNQPLLHKKLAALLIEQGDDVHALPHLEAATRLVPGDVTARNDLGLACLRLGKTENATRQFQMILQSDPDNAAAHDNLGVLFASQGRMIEAASHLRRAIALAPGNINTHLNLGNVLAAQKEFGDAATEFATFLQSVPDHVPARISYGAVLLELGRREQAIFQFRDALRRDSGATLAREQLRFLGVDPD